MNDNAEVCFKNLIIFVLWNQQQYKFVEQIFNYSINARLWPQILARVQTKKELLHQLLENL
jgi:hypothetical protein